MIGYKKNPLVSRIGEKYLLFATSVLLPIFGILMSFDASYYYALKNEATGFDPYFFLKRNIVWYVAGFVLYLVGSKIRFKTIRNLAVIGMGGAIFLLVLLVAGLGKEVNGAVRWIQLGPITIMPGEITKLALIAFIATFFKKNPEKIHDFKRGLLPIFAVVAVCFLLILKQPNLSTAATLLVIAFGMLIVAGLSKEWILLSFAVTGIGGVAAISTGMYRMDRIAALVDPFADASGNGFQLAQSLLALGSGGIKGVGLSGSIQKTMYLPESHTDFVLSIMGEEFGFIGVCFLMTVYTVLAAVCIHITINTEDRFSMLLGSGITIMLVSQVIFNAGIVSGFLPPTGVALPFISYGGNSMMIFMFSMGLMANIAETNRKLRG